MKKLLLLIVLLLTPLSAFAAIGVSWTATSTDKGNISPTVVNGNSPSVLIQGKQLVVGSTTLPFGCPASTCGYINGSDNSTNGVQLFVGNTLAGPSSYSGINLENDKGNSNLTNFSGIFFNSSAYSDTTFGTGVNNANQFVLQNTLANLSLVTSSTTSSNAFINFLTGGAAASNERMRILSTGAVGIGLTNPGSILEIQGTSTAATGQAFIAWDSGAKNIFQIANNGSTTIGNFGTCASVATNSSGTFICGTSGGSSFGNAFTYVQASPNNYLIPTTTAVGLLLTASSTFQFLSILNSTTTNATTTNLAITGNASNCNTTNALTTNSTGVVGCTAQPQGTVTAISVATANGFAGSSSGGTTPALTLTTTITGLLKGNGASISAATPGSDYDTFAYPFIGNATSTLLSFTGGINASSTVLFQNGSTGTQFNWNSSTGRLGLGTSTPYAQFALIATSTTGTNAPAFLFVIASTTAGTATSTLFSVSNTGATQVFTPTNLTNAFSVLNNASTNVFNIDTTGTLPAFQIGTSTGSTPAAELSAIALFGQVPPQNLLFALASSSQIATSTLFSVNNIGAVAINAPLNPSGGDLLTVTSADNSVFSFNRTGFMTLKFKAQDTKDRITFHTIAGSNDTDLDFDSDEAGNTRLFLQGTTGDVGVSSTSPTALLSVAGTVAAKLTAFATGDGAVCQRGSGGLLTLDAGVSSCIVSSQYVKDYLGGDSYDAAWARIQKIQVIEFTYKDTGVADIGAYAEAMANIDPRYAQYATSPRDMDGHHYNVGDPVAINWSAVQADMIVVIQHQSSGAPSKWPYALGVLFIVYIAYNEYRRRV